MHSWRLKNLFYHPRLQTKSYRQAFAALSSSRCRCLFVAVLRCCFCLGHGHFGENDAPDNGLVIDDTADTGVFLLTTSVGVFNDRLLPLDRRRRIFICIDLLAASFSKNPLANIACLMLSKGHRATNLTAFFISSASAASLSDILVDSWCYYFGDLGRWGDANDIVTLVVQVACCLWWHILGVSGYF